MRVVVLGAGVVGVTAAYYLAKAGHDVTVVEREAGAGLGTSFANAGHIATVTAHSWARPDVPGMLVKTFGREDAPYAVRLRADPAMWLWAVRFLRNCTATRFAEVAANLLRLSRLSQQLLAELRDQESLDYDQMTRGMLHLYRDAASLARADQSAQAHPDPAARPESVDMVRCLALEPALATSRESFVGAHYYPQNETGDAHKFAAGLAERAAADGVRFRYETNVQALTRDGDRVTAVATDHDAIATDAVVLSLGTGSAPLLRRNGVRLPIYPVKGYSVTIPTDGYNGAPTLGIQDGARKIGMSRHGNRLRAAGTAELAGFDTRMRERRAKTILRHAMAIFPQAGDPDKASLWTGLRPMTPDNAPILGRSPIRNLYLNTGHGSLGWTLACGSGRLIADMVSGRDPGFDLTGLTFARYQ